MGQYLSSIATLTTTRVQTHESCACPKTNTLYPSKVLTTPQTTNTLIARPMSWYGNELRLFRDVAFPLLILLLRIGPITFPTPR